MSVALAIIAVEAFEALLDGRAGGVGRSESPFSKSTTDVAAFLKSFRESDGVSGDGPLTGEFTAVF